MRDSLACVHFLILLYVMSTHGYVYALFPKRSDPTMGADTNSCSFTSLLKRLPHITLTNTLPRLS